MCMYVYILEETEIYIYTYIKTYVCYCGSDLY